ncbi:MAG: NTPase [Candidatus Aenigmarchaeota archaeon]|nr:NTPase [Candidatus Aenigmarchaeota archaeon]MDW8149309.1 NTPase [Candidatus Aenigmarchaeota archaeon]
MKKFILSGLPGSGKSTLVLKILEFLENKISVAGIITPEIRINERRVGFKVIDVFSRKEEIFASIFIRSKFKISKYFVDLEKFEKIALEALEREAEFYIIDEIGKMELLSKKFELKVLDILKNKNFLAVIHRNYLNIYKEFGKVYWLTKDNREEVFKSLINYL